MNAFHILSPTLRVIGGL